MKQDLHYSAQQYKENCVCMKNKTGMHCRKWHEAGRLVCLLYIIEKSHKLMTSVHIMLCEYTTKYQCLKIILN